MDLRLYFDIIKRRILIIIIVTAVALTVVTVMGIITIPVYKATATMRIMLDPGLPDYMLRSDANDRLLRTYEHVLSSPLILDTVLTNLAPRTSSMNANELFRQLEVEIVPETELIMITIENADPILARDLANMFGTALIEYAENLYKGNQQSVTQLLERDLVDIEKELEQARTSLDELLARDTPTAEIEALKTRIKNLEISQELRWRQYESASLAQNLQVNSITLVQPATIPGTPANSLSLKYVALTMALGLAGGIGLALVLENLDNRIRSPQQLERLTHLPVIGVVPRGTLTLKDTGRIDKKNGQGYLIEAYRLVSLNLQQITNSSFKTILITSAGPNEGKTTVATNLAQVLAERGKTLFLLEADMRHPSLAGELGVNGHVGLSSLLAELSTLDQVILTTEQSTLFVIGSGPVPPNPASLLASPDMDRLLDYLGNQGQLTLIDAPPVLGVADVSILAPKVDGVIFVVQQDLTAQEQVTQALKQLHAVQANILCSVYIQKRTKEQAYA